jgi:hypothetical protein
MSKHANAKGGHGGYVGPTGHIPRGTYHKYHAGGGGSGSAKVGVIRSPYKDTIVRRGGSAR